MGRIRSIKPEFPQSESMGRVGRDARLLFVMLWTIVDDSGRTRAASRMLASLLFPYDDDAPRLIDGWLSELEREHCIVRYVVDGSSYLEICNWLAHQKIDKPSAAKFPGPQEASRALASPRESSSLDQGPRTKDQGPRNTEAHAPDQAATEQAPGSTASEHLEPDSSIDRSAKPPGDPAADDGGATPPPVRTKPQLGIRDCPADVAPDVWRDFLAVRDGKRARVTETAIASLRREALRAGWTLEEVLRESTARGWQGFKAEWVLREAAANGDGRASPRGRNGGAIPKQVPNGYYGAPGQEPVQEI